MNRPLVLLFDASTPALNLALARHDAHEGLVLLAGRCEHDLGYNASNRLVEGLTELLAQVGATMSDVGLLACGVGPGTFTGTRVAVATAKGLALALDCKILAIDSLRVIGASCNAPGTVLALLDARRQEVYAAGMNVMADTARPLTLASTWLETSCSAIETTLSQAAATLNGAPYVVVGPGVEPYLQTIASDPFARPVVGPHATPLGLVIAAQEALDRGDRRDARAVEVLYLRASYAELGVHVPKQPLYDNPWLLPSDRVS